MSRSDTAPDEVDDLLHAVGRGDAGALAALYDRTAPGGGGPPAGAGGGRAAPAAATVRVYVQVWRTASAFDPAAMSGGTFLLEAVHRELDARGTRADPAGGPNAPDGPATRPATGPCRSVRRACP